MFLRKDTGVILFFLLSPAIIYAQNISGSWTTASSTGFSPRYNLSCSAINGKIYAIGGFTGSSDLNTVEVFDPISNIWTTPLVSGNITARHSHTACVVDNKIYLIGGNGTPILDVFDPVANTWNTPATNGNFTHRVGLTSAVVNGKIYTFGGNQFDIGITNLLEVFDPATNSWSTPITSGRFTPRTNLASAVIDDKIYVLGGDDSTGVLNTLEIFDPATNTWTTPNTSGTFTGRYSFGCGVINGKIYVIGGFGQPKPTEVFDPATNAWSTVNTSGTFTDRGMFGFALTNGKIYTIGGFVIGMGAVNINEVFAPTTNRVEMSINESPIHLYPNPANGIINIIGLPENTINVTIVNLLGSIVFSLNNPRSSNLGINLPKLPPGIYYVRIISTNAINTRKIILQ
jgi:N-acetylneuraminic acid mutarotase